MTIKEFARLCSCTTQTLRYYDRIGLLKPAMVDPWSSYRHYDAQQALDFVKIKNLQAADFSIQEIKDLLNQPDSQIYAAFDGKIAEQEQKLCRIREIQKSYLTEKNHMEQIIYSMTDYLLSQCTYPEVLTEFGLDPADAPEILARLRRYLNRHILENTPSEDVTMTVNDEVIQGHQAVLERIQSLTKENLTDTILLNDTAGQSIEHTHDPVPWYEGCEVIWERSGWAHLADVMGEFPRLEAGREYRLWFSSGNTAYSDDLSYSLFLVGAILRSQQADDIILNCSTSIGEGRENRFRLLVKVSD